MVEKRLSCLFAMAVLLSGLALGQDEVLEHEDEHPYEPGSSNAFHVDSLRTWWFRSYLPDPADDARTLGIELDARFGLGKYWVKNINYVELADYPVPIPGRPVGNGDPAIEGASGFTDLITGFWFSPKDAHHGKHHFAPGIAFQWPTGAADALSSGKYSLGPSIDYEYESGNLFTGFIAIQFWSVAGDSDAGDVNMMMIKPFLYYSLNDKWDLVYEPYGISIYWDKPSGEKLYLPIGGGIQRSFHAGSQPMVMSLQFLKYVERPSKGTEYDLRLLVEFDF